MELIKLSIKLNRDILLTRIVDRSTLSTMKDFVEDYRELFDDQLYALITNPQNDSAIDRIKCGHMRPATIANRKYITLIPEYPTTKDIEWVNVSINTSDRIWHGHKPLVVGEGYRGEIIDAFSVFKPNQLRELAAEGRRFVAGLSDNYWENLRIGFVDSVCSDVSDYKLQVTPIGLSTSEKQAMNNWSCIQIFTPELPGDFDGDVISRNEPAWEFRPLSIDDFPSFIDLINPAPTSPEQRVVKPDTVGVTPIMDWVNQTTAYLTGTGRRPGKLTATQSLTKVVKLLEKWKAEIAAGKDPDKVMVMRGYVRDSERKVRFVLTYTDFTSPSMESKLTKIFKDKFKHELTSVEFIAILQNAMTGNIIVLKETLGVYLEYIE